MLVAKYWLVRVHIATQNGRTSLKRFSGSSICTPAICTMTRKIRYGNCSSCASRPLASFSTRDSVQMHRCIKTSLLHTRMYMYSNGLTGGGGVTQWQWADYYCTLPIRIPFSFWNFLTQEQFFSLFSILCRKKKSSKCNKLTRVFFAVMCT